MTGGEEVEKERKRLSQNSSFYKDSTCVWSKWAREKRKLEIELEILVTYEQNRKCLKNMGNSLNAREKLKLLE